MKNLTEGGLKADSSLQKTELSALTEVNSFSLSLWKSYLGCWLKK